MNEEEFENDGQEAEETLPLFPEEAEAEVEASEEEVRENARARYLRKIGKDHLI